MSVVGYGSDVRNETIATAVHGFDVGRRLGAIVERLADLADAYLNRGIADDDVGPYRRKELVLGHETLRAAGEMVKDVERLARERDGATAAREARIGRCQTEGSKQ